MRERAAVVAPPDAWGGIGGVLRVLNRSSDFLFAAARVAAAETGEGDVPYTRWQVREGAGRGGAPPA